MLLASLLFFAAGLLNGAYPGGAGWVDQPGTAWITHGFGMLNILVAFWVWRGSERGLLTRIVLAAVFLGIVAVLALRQPTGAPLIIYFLTALIEVVIVVDAIRVWRISHEADTRDLEMLFSLETPLPVSVAPPPPSVVLAPAPEVPRGPAVLSARLTWILGLLSLALAVFLVADGVSSGFVPGGAEWTLHGERSGWLVYVFALLVLAVAVRAVYGSTLALRLLLAIGLLVLVERLFSSLVVGAAFPSLALHVIAALLALGTAVAAFLALQAADRARRSTTLVELRHATVGK
jgi:hypothetical protein